MSEDTNIRSRAPPSPPHPPGTTPTSHPRPTPTASPSTSTTSSPHTYPRPGPYLRISSDRFGLKAGVDRQHEDAADTRRRLRWGPFTKVCKENDTSAFKKRKVVRDDGTIDWVVVRPKFRELLADLAGGVIDGVIFYDLDRLVRQPRDLEDLTDIIEYVKRPAVGATGGRMNLINDSDRHMARMMCVMALKSSEDASPQRSSSAVRLARGSLDGRPQQTISTSR